METYAQHSFPDPEDYEGEQGKSAPIQPNVNPAEVGIIKELSPFKTLTRIRENLNGNFWDEAEKEYKHLEGYEPLMNKFGINKFLAILGAVLNDTITMSNIPPDEANALIEHVCDNVIPVMHIHYQEWGIKSKGDLEILDTQIFMMTYGAIHQGKGAGNRAVVRGTVAENIVQRSSNMPYPDTKQGFLSKLNPFSRL